MPAGENALRVGLIGCGDIARAVHLDALARCPHVRLTALAESRPDRLADAARRAPGAATFADYRDLLGSADVDAVLVALPPRLHAEVASAAFEARRHVYLEKPIATSLADASRVVEAWRASGRVGMAGFNGRFNPLYRKAADCLRAGRLGELVAARSSLSCADRPVPDWKRSREHGGGALLDLASHHADLVRFLFGREVREVFADARSLSSEGDVAAVQLRLDDGLIVQSLFSLRAVDEDRFEVYGRAGKLTVDRRESFDLEVTEQTATRTRLGWLGRALASLARSPNLAARLAAPSREPAYDAAIERFALAARGSAPPGPDLEDGYRSLQIVLAAEESARTGRPVTLAPRPHESSARA